MLFDANCEQIYKIVWAIVLAILWGIPAMAVWIGMLKFADKTIITSLLDYEVMNKKAGEMADKILKDIEEEKHV